MAQQTITINVPEGKKAVWDEAKHQIRFEEINILERVKSFEDACKVLNLDPEVILEGCFDNQEVALRKLKVILKALNEGHKFDLVKGDVFYPWIRIVREDSMSSYRGSDYTRNHKISYNGKTYFLVGGVASNGSNAGLASFYSPYGVGYSNSNFGLLSCKTREIAQYVSRNFSRLIFEACYAHHEDYDIVDLV